MPSKRRAQRTDTDHTVQESPRRRAVGEPSPSNRLISAQDLSQPQISGQRSTPTLRSAHQQVGNQVISRLLNGRGGAPDPARTVIRRKLTTKGSSDGDKIDGSARSVRKEVSATITRNKGGELSDDIAKLERSIASRQTEQNREGADTEAGRQHQARIDMETEQLARLRPVRAAQLAAKAPKAGKPMPDEDGWTKV